tara:strand:+ start:3740 stop:4852 length:1113 start_codon:yes stop_codon:yes gene_type:complete
MSRGDLQEMEVGTKQSKTAVNSGAAAGDPMQKTPNYVPDNAAIEDLGGPTPQNSKPDDNSNALKTPTRTMKQVKDVVNKGAGAADPMPSKPAVLNQGDDVEIKDEQEVVAEEPTKEETPVVSEEEKVDIESKIEEDVTALLGTEELSEEFKSKAKVVFEAAINSKVEEFKKELAEENDKKLTEEIESHKVELTERLDSYLEYVAEEWLEENSLAIENGIKTEMTESFLDGMKKLFEEHYVALPEEKYDVLESMVDKLDEMETKLNEQIERNVSLNKRLGESTAQTILNDVAEGLAVSQKEKLASLAESVEFESEDNYREKLGTLKEAYFPSKSGTPKETAPEELNEESKPAPVTSDAMSSYLNALGTVVK